MASDGMIMETVERKLARGYHFPVRCVCCYQEIEPEDILFRGSDRIKTAAEHNRVRDAEADDQQKLDGEEENWGGQIAETRTSYMTVKQLASGETKRSFEMTGIETQEAPDERMKGLKRGSIPSAIYGQVKDEEYILKKRYCPRCKNVLPEQAGTVPTYLVTLLGPTRAGKTVFLCALYRALTYRINKLPCGGTLSGIASTTYDSVKDLASRMYEGFLPGTTVNMFSKPVVLSLTYERTMVIHEETGRRPKKGAPSSDSTKTVTRQCLFAISDMKGEAFHNMDSLDDQAALTDLYLKTDGFLFFADPKVMPGVQEGMGLENQDGGAIVASMRTIITNSILANYPGNKVDKPCVAFVTKVDMLLNGMQKLMGEYPVTRGRQKLCSQNVDYYEQIDQETRSLMNKLSAALYRFLSSSFTNSFYTSVSALGFDPELGENDRINQVPNLKSSIRLVQPVVMLLAMLGFLPPYRQWEEIPEKPKELSKREERDWNEMIAEAQEKNDQRYADWLNNASQDH